MTKEDALFFLERFRRKGINEKLYEALGVAIEALSCSEIPNSSDCISRQAAKEAYCKKICCQGAFCPDGMCKEVNDTFDALPSAQPKKGKWEITNLGAVGVFDSCSECKRVVKHKAPFYNFCPNCGADMRGEQDAEIR